VQCDEVRPVCGRCAKRYIGLASCEYPVPTGYHSYQPGHLSGLTVRPTGTANDPATRSFEMRLMYHYTRTACFVLPSCNGESSKDMWESRIPLLAFQSDIILDAILVISALHLQYVKPEGDSVAYAATKYLDRALTKHRMTLPLIDSSRAESLFVSAVLISIAAWLQFRRVVPGERYALPMHAYNMIKGVSSLYLWKKSLFDDAGYGWYGQEDPVSVDEALCNSSPALHNVDDDLDQLAKKFHVEQSSERGIYVAAFEYVRWLYRVWASGGDPTHLHRFIGTMPLRLPPGYLCLLAKQDPLAMALLARSLVLLKLIDYAWWVCGGGEYDVVRADVPGICELMPPDCLWTMAWPLNVLSGEIKLQP
jgi:hypothetical protein